MGREYVLFADMPGAYAKEIRSASRTDERLTPHFPNPRAHHDDAGMYIEDNQVERADLKIGGQYENLPILHVHETKLSLSAADACLQKAKMADRYTVTGIQGCTSSLDKKEPTASFIILKRKEPIRPTVPRSPTQELIDRLPPPEPLTEEMVGYRLYEMFEGYDQDGSISGQLSFLFGHHLIDGTADGYPPYILRSPNPNDPVHSWRKRNVGYNDPDPATTETYSQDSPYIDPSSINYASEIITTTNAHHFFRNWTSRQHDMVIARDGNDIVPCSYIKGQQPIEPVPLRLNDVFGDPLWTEPSTMIQLWTLSPNWDTYHLQVTLQTRHITLPHLFRVLGTPSYAL